jgi:PAS domain S-box-containing protein
VAERTAALRQSARELQAEIAERAAIEDGLRASSELLQATFDAAPFPICVERTDATVMMWNKAAEQAFGFATEEIVGTLHQRLYVGTDDTAEGLLRRAAAGEPLRDVPTVLRNRDGRALEVSMSSAPVREPDGRIRAVVYALEDVTQRNAVEAQLRQAQKMEAIGNLTGGMAHDFNNLLGVIIGNLDSLGESVTADPENGPMVQEAIDASLRGADLTRRLLAFARRQPLHPEHFDLNVHVEQVTGLLRRMLGEDILFDIRTDRAPLPVLADRVQLEAAITNIANNARDAMPRGGRLMVRTARAPLDADYADKHPEVRPGDYALTEICDTGSGIDPRDTERIFEPFFTTKEEGRGSGLGLAMVFGFCKQSGGHINVYSEPGRGTCFRIYLPLVPSKGAEEGAALPKAPPQTGKERILVVEDNARLRQIVSVQLASLGYDVAETDNAVQALEMLHNGPRVDLLFTDIVMAGEMNGSDLARAAQRVLPDLKIVLTSGFPEARTDSAGWRGGAFKLLVKPYRKDDLARTLREVLDGGEGSVQAAATA